VRRVPIGPSATKLLLDALMLSTIVRRVVAERYDVIHSHEEMGLVGVWLARMLRIPHLYDMHSSLPQQLGNFRYSRSRLLQTCFTWAERQMIHRSRVVVTICRALQDAVTAMGAGERAVLIENVMGGDVEDPPTFTAAEVRTRWGIPAAAPLVLYTGTFEAYQGVELLLHASALLAARRPQVRVLVVGGEPQQVERMQALACEASANALIFTGQQAAREIPAFIAAADVLVSPRIRGTNTPLKIYSYLRSGKPIVATDLVTHTQVLTADVSRLVPPDAESLAAALCALVDQPDVRARLAGAALNLARDRYSRDAYVRRTAEAYARLVPRADPRPEPAPDRTARQEMARR
jgi:glycosyltransferase involved in cell wall biosynthesis